MLPQLEIKEILMIHFFILKFLLILKPTTCLLIKRSSNPARWEEPQFCPEKAEHPVLRNPFRLQCGGLTTYSDKGLCSQKFPRKKTRLSVSLCSTSLLQVKVFPLAPCCWGLIKTPKPFRSPLAEKKTQGQSPHLRFHDHWGHLRPFLLSLPSVDWGNSSCG